jgi:hypothetical protein
MGTKFRETMWFKKGVLDAQAAEQAAADDDTLRPATADMLPVEDRYDDDGTVTHEDSQMFSVRTGSTQCVPRIVSTTVPPISRGDGLDMLVRQMKRGRHKVFAMIAIGVAAVVVVACVV